MARPWRPWCPAVTESQLRIDRDRREVLVDGVLARLGVRAFDVLVALAQRRGQFVSKGALLDLAWPGLVVEENNLEVQVSTLRRLLGRDAILTVPGRGYSFALLPATPPPGASIDAWCFLMPPPGPPRHNLPQSLTSFIGREPDIAQLLELAGKTRLLTLTGSGGCGKTRLSIELGRSLLPRFADGAWLVELAALTDPALVPKTVAKAFGLRDAPGKSALELLTEHLATRKVLLVLDNAEHLLDACAQLVGTVLGGCAGVMVLASSRTLLGITGELTYRVPSLAVPDLRVANTPDRLAQCDAARLFVERVQLHRPDFVLDDSNAAAVARICNRLDGIPLAIELAAARLRSLSLEDVVGRLEHSFELLVGGSRTALPRHQTLRALIDWSHDLLTPAERRLFAGLHVFAGGCTLEAAQQVCARPDAPAHEVLDLLTALADKSLLTAEDHADSTRYRMLETVWQFAGAKLHATEDEPDWRARHCCAYAAFAKRAQLGIAGTEQADWLGRIDADLDNLRAAMNWCCQAAEGAEGASHMLTGLCIASQLLRYWSTRGRAREGLDWLERFLRMVAEVETGEPVAQAHTSAGWLSFHLCDYRRATRHHRQALAQFEALGLPDGAAGALNGLASVALVQGDHEPAQRLTEQALAIHHALGDRLGAARLQNTLAGLAAARGDFVLACKAYAEVLLAMRDFRDDKGLAAVLVNMGVAMAQAGGSLAARGVFEEALEVGLRMGDMVCTAAARLNLGNAAIERGDFAAAEQYFTSSLATSRAAGDDYATVDLLECAARLRVSEGKLRAAAVIHGAAQRLRAEINAPIATGSRAAHDASIAALREAISDDATFDACWQRGRTLSVDMALTWVAQPLDVW